MHYSSCLGKTYLTIRVEKCLGSSSGLQVSDCQTFAKLFNTSVPTQTMHIVKSNFNIHLLVFICSFQSTALIRTESESSMVLRLYENTTFSDC